MIKLSEHIQSFRADRPDEWTMDEFIREAVKLEQQNAKLIEALTDIHECSRLPPKHRNRIIDEIISVSKKALDEIK